MKCSGCKISSGTLYGWGNGSYCPKCNGILRDTEVPSYIPEIQHERFKLQIAKRGKN